MSVRGSEDGESIMGKWRAWLSEPQFAEHKVEITIPPSHKRMGAHLLCASAVYKYMLLFSACKKDLTHVQYVIFVIMLFYS